ncbi:MAG: DUF3108 domain-containing protein [Ignavibacteria bacterium]
MTKSKYRFLILVLLLAFNSRTFSQSEVLQDSEELYYEVNYSFINIGWAKFNTEKITGKPGYFTVRAKLKSNNSMPLINIDYDFISEVELKEGKLITHKFTAFEYKDDRKSTIICDFNYDSNFIYLKKTDFDNSTVVDKRINTLKRYQDGLSIFYFARLNSFTNETKDVPVLMYVDTSYMKINFSDKKTDVEISEVDHDISSVFLDGFSYFKAVFGLTGAFSGWFSNDAARIPLRAKLEVEIGNITLELKSWKRNNWSPPKN